MTTGIYHPRDGSRGTVRVSGMTGRMVWFLDEKGEVQVAPLEIFENRYCAAGRESGVRDGGKDT